MNSVNDLYRKRQGQSPSACPPQVNRCSTCGMLECLCRPRFFAGQILGAEDLNRLDAYIRGKNRLHNRQLHGWGVVNGLEVTCNPCGDGVAVGCGYALSPCGDDIVVCDAVTVDICDLIQRCKDAERKWQACTPFQHATPHECEAGEEEWILAIRYAEAPTRGVQPLRPTPDCTGGAGCGCDSCSGGGRGCGCGASGDSRCTCGTAKSGKPRGAPVQCEPTVVCEGFAFEVYRKPPDQLKDQVRGAKKSNALNPDSELFKRFECCTMLLIDEMPQLPGDLDIKNVEANPQAWYNWISAARVQLRRYLQTHGSTNCELLDQFKGIDYPPAGTKEHTGAIFLAAVLLLVVWFDALLTCFCSALLPPCPPPSNDVRVPLASVHIDGHPCRVNRVCNWTVHRKIAITMPTLGYWLSLLPVEATVRKLLELVCCFDFGVLLRGPQDVRQPDGMQPQMVDVPGQPEAGIMDSQAKEAHVAYQQVNELLNLNAERPDRIRGGAELLRAALQRVNKPLEFGTLVNGLLARDGIAGHESALSVAEGANLPQFLLLNQLLRPLAGAAVVGGPSNGDDRAEPLPAMQDEIAAMRKELAGLRESVKAQAAEIERIKGKP